VLIADGPDVGLGGVVDDSIVINQGTSARPQPQLLFHSVHGINVRTSKGGRLAKRFESFCKGLAFSNRPIAIDENVCLRFAEIATNWSGVLRFGVTNTDPATLREDLPK
jgi:protein neuralized